MTVLDRPRKGILLLSQAGHSARSGVPLPKFSTGATPRTIVGGVLYLVSGASHVNVTSLAATYRQARTRDVTEKQNEASTGAVTELCRSCNGKHTRCIATCPGSSTAYCVCLGKTNLHAPDLQEPKGSIPRATFCIENTGLEG